MIAGRRIALLIPLWTLAAIFRLGLLSALNRNAAPANWHLLSSAQPTNVQIAGVVFR